MSEKLSYNADFGLSALANVAFLIAGSITISSLFSVFDGNLLFLLFQCKIHLL